MDSVLALQLVASLEEQQQQQVLLVELPQARKPGQCLGLSLALSVQYLASASVGLPVLLLPV